MGCHPSAAQEARSDGSSRQQMSLHKKGVFLALLNIVAVIPNLYFLKYILSDTSVSLNISFLGPERQEHHVKDCKTPSKNTEAPKPRFAYAFANSGCTGMSIGEEDVAPQQLPASTVLPSSSCVGYILNAVVTASILRNHNSTSDVIMFVRMETEGTILPPHQVDWLQRAGVKLQYVPSVAKSSFATAVLEMFRALELYDYYDRVYMIDGDVIPCGAVTDDHMQMSYNGVLQPTVAVQGMWSPIRASMTVFTPKKGDFEKVLEPAHTLRNSGKSFNTKTGWGHQMKGDEKWEGWKLNGKSWNFHGVAVDQGLLYHWLKYETKNWSEVQYQTGEVKTWQDVTFNKTYWKNLKNSEAAQPVTVNAVNSMGEEETRYIAVVDTFMPDWKTCEKVPGDSSYPPGFYHYGANSKPWMKTIRAKGILNKNFAKITKSTKQDFWLYSLGVANLTFQLNLPSVIEPWKSNHYGTPHQRNLTDYDILLDPQVQLPKTLSTDDWSLVDSNHANLIATSLIGSVHANPLAALAAPVSRNSNASWRGYKNDRVIAFVHIGKAGGMSFRNKVALRCMNPRGCFQYKAFDPKTQVLASQTNMYFHIFNLRPEYMVASTAFLFNLRDPVDRAVSAYRYAHPQNCKAKNKFKGDACTFFNKTADSLRQTNPKAHLFYHECFPEASMERFAQNVLSPWPKSSSSPACRRLGREFLQGGRHEELHNFHMYYNYQYYFEKSIGDYPGREIFAIRMKHEGQDLMNLDKAIGGDGSFWESMTHDTHGSQNFVPSPLSDEATQKVCCVLETEISVYLDLLDRSLNLNEAAKEDSKEELRKKCGKAADETWHEWRRHCQSRMSDDARELYQI